MMQGRERERFRYWDKGSMATIGRNRAVADLHWFHFSGLLAWLAWQWRDIAAAEDALAEAFALALSRWPIDGVPSAPDAWLLTTARRNLLMAARRVTRTQKRP